MYLLNPTELKWDSNYKEVGKPYGEISLIFLNKRPIFKRSIASSFVHYGEVEPTVAHLDTPKKRAGIFFDLNKSAFMKNPIISEEEKELHLEVLEANGLIKIILEGNYLGAKKVYIHKSSVADSKISFNVEYFK